MIKIYYKRKCLLISFQNLISNKIYEFKFSIMNFVKIFAILLVIDKTRHVNGEILLKGYNAKSSAESEYKIKSILIIFKNK